MERDGCRTVTMETRRGVGPRVSALAWRREEVGGSREPASASRRRLGDDPALDRARVRSGRPRRSSRCTTTTSPRRCSEEFAPQFAALLNTMPWDDLDHGEIVVTPGDPAPRVRAHGSRGHEAPHRADARAQRRDLGDDRHHLGAAPAHDPATSCSRACGPTRGAAASANGSRPTCSTACTGSTRTPSGSSTGNADSNGPMLAINKKMGFKQYRWGAEYQISRDKLAERVGLARAGSKRCGRAARFERAASCR